MMFKSSVNPVSTIGRLVYINSMAVVKVSHKRVKVKKERN